MLETLSEKSSIPVLSSHPPGYNPDLESEKTQYVSRLFFREFTKDGILMLISTPMY